MKSLIAIVAGSAFIIIAILFLQLAYIFVAVAYNALAKDFLFLNEISGYFRYIVGIPVFMATMFAGGYITAHIADMDTYVKTWLHSLVVGLITVGGMMYSAMVNSTLTITGIVVIVLALSATAAGSYYWQKNDNMA